MKQVRREVNGGSPTSDDVKCYELDDLIIILCHFSRCICLVSPRNLESRVVVAKPNTTSISTIASAPSPRLVSAAIIIRY